MSSIISLFDIGRMIVLLSKVIFASWCLQVLVLGRSPAHYDIFIVTMLILYIVSEFPFLRWWTSQFDGTLRDFALVTASVMLISYICTQ